MENIIITIARQFGSGGKTIGEMYAAKKGINCYSREILKMASEDSGINELLFHKADERVKGNALFGMAKRIYKGDLISPESDDFVSDRNLFNYQAKIIKQLAEQEPCVIVGRFIPTWSACSSTRPWITASREEWSGPSSLRRRRWRNISSRRTSTVATTIITIPDEPGTTPGITTCA